MFSQDEDMANYTIRQNLNSLNIQDAVILFIVTRIEEMKVKCDQLSTNCLLVSIILENCRVYK